MQKFISKRLVAILMVIVMAVALIPSMVVSANEPPPFSLITLPPNNSLVADGGTRFITTYTQDHITKMIKATVSIQHGSTDARDLEIMVVGVEISFGADVAPHAYYPTFINIDNIAVRDYANPRPDYSSSLLFPVNGSSIDNRLEFYKYCDDLVDGVSTYSNTYIRRGPNGGVIATQIAATDEANALRVPRGTTVDVIEFYFMPVNRDVIDLNINMFGYEYVFDGPAGMIRNSPMLINGNYRLEADNRNIPIVYTYVHSPYSFKVHVKRPVPDVFAKDDRTIGGYDPSYMEWSDDGGVTYQSGTPTVPDGGITYHIRGKGDDAYSRPAGFNDSQYGNYKKYLPSDPAIVTFVPNFMSCEDDVYLTKSSQKAPPTHADGKVRENDVIIYTITAWNDGHQLSEWANAVLTDTLPAGVTFLGNVRLNGILLSSPGGYTFNSGTLTVPLGNIPGGGGGTPTPPASLKQVTFEATVDGSVSGMIYNTAVVTGTDGVGGNPLIREASDRESIDGGIEIVFRSAAPTIDTITEGDRTISGDGVTDSDITVTLPGSTSPITVKVIGGRWTVNVPDGVNLVEGDEVVAVQTEPGKDPSVDARTTVVARPDPEKIRTKTAVNLDRVDQTRHVGNILEYTITVKNDGQPKSLWTNVIILDTLPTTLDFEGLSYVMINGVAAGSAATFSAGVLRVELGDLPGGVEKLVTFRVKINESAAGQVIRNTAVVDGDDVVEPPTPPVVDRSPKPTIDEVNEGDRIITGTGDPNAEEAWIEVSFPNSTLVVRVRVRPDGTWEAAVPGGINLEEGDEVKAVQIVTYDGEARYPSEPAIAPVNAKKPVEHYITKTSENQTSTDGKTRVGDRVQYIITVGNSGSPKSYWTDVTVKDVIPVGLTMLTSSVRIDGKSPAYMSYDETTRLLELTVWRGPGDIGIQGGTFVVLTFDVLVEASAYGKTIVNVVSVEGYENDSDKLLEDEVDDDGGFTVLAQSEKPEIDEVTRGDRTISGRGRPGSRIIVTLDDGTELETTVDNNGNWEVDLGPNEVDEDDVIIAVQIEKGADGGDLDPSEPADTIVVDKNYRAIHGYVWPMVIDDLGEGDWFLSMHDVIVELRPSFLGTADPNLSVKAVVVPNSSRPGLGEFTIEGVLFGDYVLVIHRPGYLARAMNITVKKADPDMIELKPPGTEDAGVFNIWWGDVDGSLRIDTADIAVVIQQISLGVNVYDSRYNPACDVDANGRPDTADVALIIRNLDRHVYLYAGGEDVDYFN